MVRIVPLYWQPLARETSYDTVLVFLVPADSNSTALSLFLVSVTLDCTALHCTALRHTLIPTTTLYYNTLWHLITFSACICGMTHNLDSHLRWRPQPTRPHPSYTGWIRAISLQSIESRELVLVITLWCSNAMRCNAMRCDIIQYDTVDWWNEPWDKCNSIQQDEAHSDRCTATWYSAIHNAWHFLVIKIQPTTHDSYNETGDMRCTL